MPARPGSPSVRKPAATTVEPAPVEKPEADTAAVDAAIAEATGKDNVFTVEFRGQKFDIDRDVLNSARFLMALARGRDHELMFEILGDKDSGRFIALCKRGESLPPIASEFFAAINKAAGLGNS